MAFTIKHYAGEVQYSVYDFCFKNKDLLYVSLVIGMQTSQNALMKRYLQPTPAFQPSFPSEQPLSTSPLTSLYPEDVTASKASPPSSGKKIRCVRVRAGLFPSPKTSLATYLRTTHPPRDSAQHLIKKLKDCQPHYVRCIKSNDKREALGFNSARVKHQVKYLGLSENIKVGYLVYATRAHTKHSTHAKHTKHTHR